MTTKLYQYPKCGTCRKAIKWLGAQGIDHESIDIVTSPPSKTALKKIQKLAGVPIAKMFNTSGQSYRQGGFKAKLPEMTEDQAFAALAADGKLIKRPLLVGDGVALIGFKEADWQVKLG